MQFTKSTVAILFTLLASVSAVAIPGTPAGVTGNNGMCDQSQVTHCCDTATTNEGNGFLALGGLSLNAVCTNVDAVTGLIPGKIPYNLVLWSEYG